MIKKIDFKDCKILVEYQEKKYLKFDDTIARIYDSNSKQDPKTNLEPKFEEYISTEQLGQKVVSDLELKNRSPNISDLIDHRHKWDNISIELKNKNLLSHQNNIAAEQEFIGPLNAAPVGVEKKTAVIDLLKLYDNNGNRSGSEVIFSESSPQELKEQLIENYNKMVDIGLQGTANVREEINQYPDLEMDFDCGIHISKIVNGSVSPENFHHADNFFNQLSNLCAEFLVGNHNIIPKLNTFMTYIAENPNQIMLAGCVILSGVISNIGVEKYLSSSITLIIEEQQLIKFIEKLKNNITSLNTERKFRKIMNPVINTSESSRPCANAIENIEQKNETLGVIVQAVIIENRVRSISIGIVGIMFIVGMFQTGHGDTTAIQSLVPIAPIKTKPVIIQNPYIPTIDNVPATEHELGVGLQWWAYNVTNLPTTLWARAWNGIMDSLIEKGIKGTAKIAEPVFIDLAESIGNIIGSYVKAYNDVVNPDSSKKDISKRKK